MPELTIEARSSRSRCSYAALFLLLSLVLALTSLAFAPRSAFAADNAASVSYKYMENKVEKDGPTTRCTSISEAMNKAKSVSNGATRVIISLEGDWYLSTYGYALENLLVIPEGKNYEFHLNGHMIDAKSDSWSLSSWRSAFRVAENATLTIKGSDGTAAGGSEIEHGGYLSNITSAGGGFWHSDAGRDENVIKGGLITGVSNPADAGLGAIQCSKGCHVNLENVTLAGNKGESGGAVLLSGDGDTLTINNSAIKWNYACKQGGGVAVTSVIGGSSSIELKNGSVIWGNQAESDGGGIATTCMNTTIKLSGGSKVCYNYCKGSGGGIFSSVSDAGINEAFSDATSITLEGGSGVESNMAEGNGGGIAIDDYYESTFIGVGGITYGTRRVTINKDSHVSKNWAGKNGGGLYLRADKSDSESSLPNVDSPGIVLSMGIAANDGSSIADNKANKGGGIYSTGTLDQEYGLFGSSISGNYTRGSAADGGGIYTDAETTVALDAASKVSDNKAAAFGGGIYSKKNLSMAMDAGSAVSGNEAEGGDGGGFLLKGVSAIALYYKSTISGNKCAQLGGGISVASDTEFCKLSGDGTCTIKENAAAGGSTDGEGGGVAFMHNATMSGLVVRDNKCTKSTSCGGGVYVYNAKVNILDCTITGNTVAGSKGGGIGIRWKEAKAVLGGKVIVKDNKNASGAASDVYCNEPTNASKSDIEGDANSLPNCRISVSLSSPLKKGSTIGLEPWSDASGVGNALYHPVSVRGEKFTTDTSYFFSDDSNWYVSKENDELVLHKVTEGTVTAYGADSDKPVKTFKADYGSEVTLKSSDYPKTSTYGNNDTAITWMVDYWDLTMSDGTREIVSADSSGNATFTMPNSDVVARAHYASPVVGFSVEISELAAYKDLKNEDGAATLGTVTLMRGDGAWVKMPSDGVQIRSRGVTYEKDGSQCDVLYVLLFHRDALKKLGFYTDDTSPSEFMQTSTTSDGVSGSYRDRSASKHCLVPEDPSSDLVLSYTAEFKNPYVTVTLDPNGGSCDKTSLTCLKNKAVGELPTPTAPATDKVFYGWKIKDSSPAEYVTSASTFDKDTTLTAVWVDKQPETRLVRFFVDGKLAGQQQVKAKSKVTKPDAPELEGHDFKGWYLSPTGDGPFDFETTVEVSETPLDIYAVYTPKSYEVSFDANGGKDAPKSQSVEYGGHIDYSILTAPTKTGYDFAGWALPNGSLCELSTYTVTDDVKLTAVWVSKVYTVKFYNSASDEAAGKDPFATQQVVHGEKPTLLTSDPTLDSQRFTGWYTNEACDKDHEFSFNKAVTSDTSVYAGWADLVNVTLDYGGNGEENEVLTIDKGSALGALPQPMAYRGHVFKGWELADGTKVTEETKFSESATVYAKWGLETYTVSFNTAGGSVVESQKVEYGNAAKEPEAPTLDGFIFAGWTFANGESYNFDTETVTRDLTLYAQWAKTDGGAVAYLVSFDTAGGTEIEDQIISEGGVAVKPEDPVLEGFKFMGWTLADGSDYDFGTAVTGNLTLYAKWATAGDSTEAYVVSFDTAGGSKVKDQVIAAGKCATEPEAPTLKGFEFKGWTLSDGTDYDFSTAVSGNLTLYAKWAASGDATESYVVAFDSAGGSKVESQVIAAGECATEPETPTRAGYTFKGWVLADGTAYDFSTPVAKSFTLTASWVKDAEPAKTEEKTAAKTVTKIVTTILGPDVLPATADPTSLVAGLTAMIGSAAAATGLRRRRRK